jgi:hypothetical protein
VIGHLPSKCEALSSSPSNKKKKKKCVSMQERGQGLHSIRVEDEVVQPMKGTVTDIGYFRGLG